METPGALTTLCDWDETVGEEAPVESFRGLRRMIHALTIALNLERIYSRRNHRWLQPIVP